METDPFEDLVCSTCSKAGEAAGVDELAAVALALNSRPRKTLDWRTPAEALNEYLQPSQQQTVATTG